MSDQEMFLCIIGMFLIMMLLIWSTCNYIDKQIIDDMRKNRLKFEADIKAIRDGKDIDKW